jgi:hypothetical protein
MPGSAGPGIRSFTSRQVAGSTAFWSGSPLAGGAVCR